MEQLVDGVAKALYKAGLVQIEVSARHVHLSKEDLEVLFGEGATLTPKRELSQPGQYLCEERVALIGPKMKRSNVAILGPTRTNTQVELSRSDCIEFGLNAPIRESGDTVGSEKIILEGPKGKLEIKEGVIIAHHHIHVPEEVAEKLGLKDKDRVDVQAYSERPILFQNVMIRVSNLFKFRMHIDFDEANAAAIQGFVLGKIIPHSKDHHSYISSSR